MEAGPVPPSSGDRPLRSTSSSMGNERTSVGPGLSRKRSLRAAMDGSSTKSSDTSVSAVIPSASRAARARAAQRSTATGWSDCSSAA